MYIDCYPKLCIFIQGIGAENIIYFKSPLYFERDARLTKVSFEGEERSTVMDPA